LSQGLHTAVQAIDERGSLKRILGNEQINETEKNCVCSSTGVKPSSHSRRRISDETRQRRRRRCELSFRVNCSSSTSTESTARSKLKVPLHCELELAPFVSVCV